MTGITRQTAHTTVDKLRTDLGATPLGRKNLMFVQQPVSRTDPLCGFRFALNEARDRNDHLVRGLRTCSDMKAPMTVEGKIDPSFVVTYRIGLEEGRDAS